MKTTKIIAIIILLFLAGLVATGYVKIKWTNKNTESPTNVNLEYNNTTEKEVDTNINTDTDVEKEESDETADWKTYTNEKYGYEIKYPSNWIITHTDSGAMFKLPGEEKPMASIFFLETDSYTDSELQSGSIEANKPIKTFLADRVAGMQNYIELDSIVPFFADSGVLGYKVTYIGSDMKTGERGSYTDIHFELKRGIIEDQTSKVATIARCVRLAGDNEYLDKIASTFKFIEPDETADWRIYENEKYGYQLKYPRNWTFKEYRGQRSQEKTRIVENVIFNSPDKKFHLLFGLKNKGDKSILLSGRTGVGGGNFIEGDTVNIGNINVKTSNLVYKEKIKEVFYPGEGNFEINGFEGHAEFSSDIPDAAEYKNLDMKNLPELETANQILSTFKFIEPDEAADWKIYKNKEYGFSLTFPESWKGYSVKKRRLSWGTFGNSDSLDFGFAAQNSLFNISIFSKKQWQDINSEPGPKPTFIDKNNNYVFAYSVAQDAANEAMISRIKEVTQIISSFKFIK